MNMLIKIKKVAPLIEIARTCGCAPCQILAVNNVKSETEILDGAEIFVPVEIKNLII
jgi:hypothetical protein